MKTLSEIRHEARMALNGHWTQPVLATLIYLLLASAFQLPTYLITDPNLRLVCSLVSGCIALPFAVFFSSPLAFGYQNALLDLTRGCPNSEETIGNMFAIAFSWKYWRVVGTQLLVGIYTVLWSLLLLIPGIIKHYAYSMAIYISRDCPDIPIDDCIYLSRKLMNGYKFKLFLLELTFIGWALLCILTLGIGLLWLCPYIHCSYAKFYDTLKAERMGDDPIDIVLQRYRTNS